jgi:soluble P-type ATPase
VRALAPAALTEAAREVRSTADEIAKSGGTPLAVARDGKLLGVVHLKDVIKGGIRERFAELRRMGIRTIMITGDNPTTAAAIAAEAGVHDFLAQATPEDKLKLIRDEQAKGKLVVICGDGTNDAPALAQADVGVAMKAGNMVDLDSNPTKLIEMVEIGKQRLMTRCAHHLPHRQRCGEVLRHHPGAVSGLLPTAAGAQHHEPRDPAECDPVGDHLQRARHHRSDPRGAEGRGVPPNWRRPAPAPQSAHLWAGRPHHAVHRHQGH